MTDNLIQRLDAFCRLYLLFESTGIPFPSSGDLFCPCGALCWAGFGDTDLHLMLTVTRRRGDRLAQALRQTALALELMPFVRHVCKHDWETSGLLDFIIDPRKISEDACTGIASEPASSVNLRAHVQLPWFPAGRKLR
jgi:hypothetical protein